MTHAGFFQKKVLRFPRTGIPLGPGKVRAERREYQYAAHTVAQTMRAYIRGDGAKGCIASGWVQAREERVMETYRFSASVRKKVS